MYGHILLYPEVPKVTFSEKETKVIDAVPAVLKYKPVSSQFKATADALARVFPQ